MSNQNPAPPQAEPGPREPLKPDDAKRLREGVQRCLQLARRVRRGQP